MAQRESRLSGNIRKAIEEHFRFRVFVFKVWGSEHMMAGLPDLIGCLEGKFFGLEVKHPETRGDVSARQEYVGALIERSGGLYRVVTTREEALSALTDLLDR
jgi:hypothetical protein